MMNMHVLMHSRSLHVYNELTFISYNRLIVYISFIKSPIVYHDDCGIQTQLLSPSGDMSLLVNRDHEYINCGLTTIPMS